MPTPALAHSQVDPTTGVTVVHLGFCDPVKESWDGNIPQRVFGTLVQLATPVVEHYHSDLFHDARWVTEYLPFPVSNVLNLSPLSQYTFYYGVRSTGTSIGTVRNLVEPFNTVTYRCTIAIEARYADWTVTMEVEAL